MGSLKLCSTEAIMCRAKDIDGIIFEDKFLIEADGSGYSWQEDMHPDGIGYYQTFWDWDVDEESFRIEEGFELLEILEPDKLEFEVEEYWEDEPEYEPDYDIA